MVAHLVVSRPGGPEFVALSLPHLCVGRSSANDIAFPDDSVSRLHAVLESRSGGWSIRDLGSRNGTWINGERIIGERALRDQDEIRLGTVRLAFRPDPTAERFAETLSADPPPDLTRRERDVLLALFQSAVTGDVFMEPASTRQVAAQLVVTEAAVKQHLARLYEKFGIEAGGDRRRVALANEALRRGAVSFSEVRAATSS